MCGGQEVAFNLPAGAAAHGSVQAACRRLCEPAQRCPLPASARLGASCSISTITPSHAAAAAAAASGTTTAASSPARATLRRWAAGQGWAAASTWPGTGPALVTPTTWQPSAECEWLGWGVGGGGGEVGGGGGRGRGRKLAQRVCVMQLQFRALIGQQQQHRAYISHQVMQAAALILHHLLTQPAACCPPSTPHPYPPPPAPPQAAAHPVRVLAPPHHRVSRLRRGEDAARS